MNIEEESQKLYEQTPATDRYTRARILSGMKWSKTEMAKIRLYLIFKKLELQ